jgi:ferritin-like metal-binding protein YciE
MTDTSKQISHEISDWLGDIVALESHVEEVMDHQLKLESGNPQLDAALKRFHDTVRDSKHRAEAYQKQYGSTAGNPVIKAGATLLGKAAGVIDKLRHDSVTKSIRDDYTAYNHVTIAYTILHTTAMALDDQATMAFAEQGMRTYAGLVQDVNHIIPEAVVHDLKAGEHAPVINDNVVNDCRATIDDVWKSTANA